MADNEPIICEFCSSILKSRYGLVVHQSKTKKCIEIQRQQGIEKVTQVFKCRYCPKEFNILTGKNVHESNCKYREFEEYKQKLDQQYKEKLALALLDYESKLLTYNTKLTTCDAEIKILRESLAKYEVKEEKQILTQTDLIKTLGSKTTMSNCNTIIINGSLNLSPKYLKTIIKETYNIEHFERGPPGTMDWAKKNLLTSQSGESLYQCTNTRDQLFVYNNPEGERKKDPRAKIFTSSLKIALRPRHVKYVDKMLNYYSDEDYLKLKALFDLHEGLTYKTVAKMLLDS
jgi:hypothetical protein